MGKDRAEQDKRRVHDKAYYERKIAEIDAREAVIKAKDALENLEVNKCQRRK